MAADPAASRIAVTVAATSVRIGSAARDRHVTGPAFLDAARYPELRFESTQVTARTDGGWDVTGAMTVNGTTTPVCFHVDGWQLSDDGQRLVLSARTTVHSSP